jgi:tetratricopeptide (TPR) repeat protein
MPVVLATLCAAAYANTLHAPFIFDDFSTIVYNPAIRRLWPLSDVTVSTFPALWGRPLLGLSLKINYALGGDSVVGYHLFNLIVHLLNAMLAFGILRRTLLKSLDMDADREETTWLAFTVAALWMLHPLSTESVTYVTQRTELLMGLFLLSTLYCFIRGAESPHRTIWFGLAIIACTLGMGAKEVMVVTPFLVFVYDYVFGTSSLRATWRGHAALYTGLAASWIALAALQLTTNLHWKSGLDVSRIGCWDYLAMQCGVLTHYLRLAAWPSGLVLDYSDWPQTIRFSTLLPRALLLSSLLVASLWAIRQRRWWGFWGAWFFLLLAPSSSLLPLPTEPAAERRMYLPLLAIMAVTLGAAWRAGRRISTRFNWPDHARLWLETAIALALALALGVTTFQRNAQYRTVRSIWADVVAKRPHNARAQTSLALALVDEGKLTEAIDLFNQTLRENPRYGLGHYNLGSVFQSQGRIEEAMEQYRQAIQLQPDLSQPHYNLGCILADQGKFADAIEQYQDALRLEPDASEVRNNLGIALALSGKRDEAIAQFQKAVELRPDFAEAHVNLGHALAIRTNFAQAITQYEEALRIDPNNASNHYDLAIAMANSGDLAEAAIELRKAAHLDPNLPDVHAALAKVLKEQGNQDEAERDIIEKQQHTEPVSKEGPRTTAAPIP